MKKADGFGHELPNHGKTNDWITPRWIIDAFGEGYFDLDPCASITQPWKCAKKQYTVEQNGLLYNWEGNVWLNPPYGQETEAWIKYLIKQLDNGITAVALIFARTETDLWQSHIFPTANGFLFPRRRIQFARPDGAIPTSSSGAPSALIAWGARNRDKLRELTDSGVIAGAFLDMAFYTGSKR